MAKSVRLTTGRPISDLCVRSLPKKAASGHSDLSFGYFFFQGNLKYRFRGNLKYRFRDICVDICKWIL